MKDSEKKWEDFFDEKARLYGYGAEALAYRNERVFYYRRDAIISSLHDLFNPLKGKEILDVGCGNGLFIKPLVSENRVTGIDMSGEMLKIAAQNGLEIIKGSVSSLPFNNELFDLVISAGVIQHLESAQEVVKECARVTKPGGLVLIETINAQNLLRMSRDLFRRSSPIVRAYRVRELLVLMRENGLKDFRLIFLYYPFSYKRKLITTSENFFHLLFSSAFAVVGIK